MRHLFVVITAAGLFGSGCAAVDRNRADAHHHAAKEEAKDLNLGKAVKQEKKAADARRDAAHDRF